MHTHTSINTQELWQNYVPQRLLLPHFSFYQAVWISLCMELLWLLVWSSWSQRQRRSPKCVCEHACCMKYLTTDCLIWIPTRVFRNFNNHVPDIMHIHALYHTCPLKHTMSMTLLYNYNQFCFSYTLINVYSKAFHGSGLLVQPNTNLLVVTFANEIAIVLYRQCLTCMSRTCLSCFETQ